MFNKKRKKRFTESDVVDPEKPGSGSSSSGQDLIEPHKFTRRQKKLHKKEMMSTRPWWRRVLRQTAKTLFIRIPLLVIVIIAVTLVTLKIYLTPMTVQNLAISFFSSVSHGSLNMEVEEFNIYRGCVIKNIVVRSGPDFNNEKVFEMERFVLRYGFFRMFTGSIRFPEIGLYKPRLYLKEKNGKWNVATLMKPSEKKAPEPEEAEDEGKEEPSDEISLPVSADFLLNFYLDDFRAYVKGEDFTSEMKGLTFHANIDVPPFKKIPKSAAAIKIIRTMRFEINPEKNMDLSFYSNGAATSPELILNWKLLFENGGKPEFNSHLEFGAKRMPLRIQKKVFSPFDFMISYDIFLNPIDDSLKITDLTVNFKGSNWLKLGGAVTGVTKNQVLKIDMKESRIPLGDLYPYYVLMTGDRSTRFNGEISLYPLTVRGSAENPDVRGEVNLKNIYFKVPGTEASIPSLVLGYSAAGPMSRMDLGLDIKAPHIAYVIDGSKSGGNGLKFNTGITATEGFSTFRINTFSLDFYDPASKSSAISMQLNGEVSTGSSMSGWVNISTLKIDTVPLKDMVPGRFRKSMADIPLKKPVRINIATRFFMGEGLTKASLDIGASVPDFGVEDLKLSTAIQQDTERQRVTVEHMTLGSKTMNLLFSLSGTVDLKRAPMSDSNIRISLEMNNSSMKNVFSPWATSGLIKLTAGMKGDLDTGVVKGNLVFSGFNLKNDKMMLELADLDMNFPFEYELAARKGTTSYLTVTQNQVIESEHFREKPNFTISSFRFKHPVREKKIEYMKDFSALMYFRDNVFRIADLKASVMDGTIYGRSLMFNLADFNKNNMEFNLVLDVTNVNIGRMDEPDYSKAIPRDAELSLSANFSGRGLNTKRELPWSGYITIYKIGNEFANRLMKGLSQEKGKSKLGKPVQFVVDNSVLVNKFEFILEKGLAYPTVKTTDRFIGRLISIQNEEIKFDRIPIQEYMRKVRED